VGRCGGDRLWRRRGLIQPDDQAGGDNGSFYRGVEAGRCRTLLEVAFMSRMHDGADIAKMLISRTWARMRQAKRGPHQGERGASGKKMVGLRLSRGESSGLSLCGSLFEGLLIQPPRLDLKDPSSDELSEGRRYRVANESPSATVHPSGNPIRLSHSFQVKFLAT